MNGNYQLTIPKEIRKEVSIEAGDEIEMVANEKKEVIICRVKKVPCPLRIVLEFGEGKKAGLIMCMRYEMMQSRG